MPLLAGLRGFTPQRCFFPQLAAERCSKSFSEAGRDREKELKLMLDWASEGFLPTGPEGFAPAGKCGYPSPPGYSPQPCSIGFMSDLSAHIPRVVP